MNDPYDLIFTEPRFEAITLEFFETRPAAEQEARAQSILENALAAKPNIPAKGWQVNTDPLLDKMVDLWPPAGETIPVGQAFELKYTIQQQAAEIKDVHLAFETYLDDGPLPDEMAAAPEAFARFAPATPDTILESSIVGQEEDEDKSGWNNRIVNVEKAWKFSEDNNRPDRGQNIRIAHPDAGYRDHVELAETLIRKDLDFDSYADRPAPGSALNTHGGTHGLGTMSVLASGAANLTAEKFVTGIAPKAEIVAIKIVRDELPVFVNPFSRGGQMRVCKAVSHAIKTDCHVLSMSMGGLWFDPVKELIHKAVYDHNMIVCAAAGQYSIGVVWPAKFKDVIAVAGCTAKRDFWMFSNFGREVDVLAPAKGVFRADFDGDLVDVKQGSGTSYAVPHVAGIAALWLAHHDRHELIKKYKGDDGDPPVPLNEVFRKVLRDSCTDRHFGQSGLFGAGIVDAEATLKARLPTREEMLASMAEMDQMVGLEALIEDEATPYTELFTQTPPEEVRTRMAILLDVPEHNLNEALARLNAEEFRFLLMTHPDLRRWMASGPQEIVGGEAAFESTIMEWPDRLQKMEMSSQLREQISKVSG